jgi:hypothetical protein
MLINQDILRTETQRRIVKYPHQKTILVRRLENFAEDMLTCNCFQAWRRSDWLGDESWDEAKSDDVANRYRQPADLSILGTATVLELANMYDANRWSPPAFRGRRNHNDPIMLGTPAMVFQIALMSRKPEHVKIARAAVEEMLARKDFDSVDLGWGYNYAVLPALWSLADPQ